MGSLLALNWKDVYFVLQIVIAASAVITIMYKILSFVLKKIKKEYDNLVTIHRMVETIYAELTPNHGTSLKDKINKIEKRLDENTTATERIMCRQRWLLDSREEPIFESDANGECTWVNNKYCSLTGYKLEEFLKNGWHNVIHQKDREYVVNEWNAAVEGKRDSHCSFRVVCKDGTIYKVHVTATRNADIGYIGSVSVDKKLEDDESV